MSTLYVLTNEAIGLLAELEDSGGEMTDAVQVRLADLAVSLPAKIDAVCRVLREFEGRAVAKKAERQRLQESETRDNNAAQRLKEYLRLCLESSGERRVATELFGVSLCRNGQPSIKWEGDAGALPEAFRKITVEPDMAAAREAVKAKLPLPEGFTVEFGMHVRVN